ncbi:MAG: hypothetical protein WKF37_09335 [Bryobacteraceae bacterium]
MRPASLFLISLCTFAQSNYRGWEHFGGTAENIHYSSLKQITKKNVKNLKIAWTFDSGDTYPGSDIQCNPIIVDSVLYATTPKLRVVALNAATGEQIWSFDGLRGQRPNHRNRGLTYWTDGRQSRIFFALSYELLSLDAKTGKLDTAFGTAGKVDMRDAFEGRPKEQVTISVPTPGVIYQDLLILGSSVRNSSRPLPEISAPTTCAPESYAGVS